MFAGISLRPGRLALLALALASVLNARPSQAGWWGSLYGCNYVTDPDYLPRRYIPRPYYIDRKTIWSGDSICHLTLVSDGNYGVSNLAGTYEADCKHGEDSERQSFSVQIVEYPDYELTLLWRPLGASDDVEFDKVGPLQRCGWGNGTTRSGNGDRTKPQ